MAAVRKHQVAPGDRYGRLIVVREVEPERRMAGGRVTSTDRRVETRCDCGAARVVLLRELVKRGSPRRGPTRSCGCLQRERAAEALRGRRPPTWVHGLQGHPLYPTWCGMIARCEHPQSHHYRHYGGRGITICAAWHDVAVFVADIERLLGPRPEGMTLDRVDNDGPYAPGNVRWATRAQQRANRRDSA